MTTKDYISYFENLCETNTDLLHSDSNHIFQSISLEEAMGEFRNKLKEKSFAFRLIRYTSDVSSSRNYDEAIQKQGGFYIMHSFKRGDKNDMNNAMDKCEKVGWEFISKMIQDSRGSHELFNYSFDNGQSVNAVPVPITGDNSYTGWLFTFTFSTFFNACINPDKWQ